MNKLLYFIELLTECKMRPLVFGKKRQVEANTYIHLLGSSIAKSVCEIFENFCKKIISPTKFWFDLCCLIGAQNITKKWGKCSKFTIFIIRKEAVNELMIFRYRTKVLFIILSVVKSWFHFHKAFELWNAKLKYT